MLCGWPPDGGREAQLDPSGRPTQQEPFARRSREKQQCEANDVELSEEQQEKVGRKVPW